MDWIDISFQVVKCKKNVNLVDENCKESFTLQVFFLGISPLNFFSITTKKCICHPHIIKSIITGLLYPFNLSCSLAIISSLLSKVLTAKNSSIDIFHIPCGLTVSSCEKYKGGIIEYEAFLQDSYFSQRTFKYNNIFVLINLKCSSP